MKVEVLYFDGCPNAEGLVAHLRAVLASSGVATVELVQARTSMPLTENAFSARQPCASTERTSNPVPISAGTSASSAGCSGTPEGLRGMPADEWVLAALECAESASG